MPDSKGNFRGQGWTRARERGWERAFRVGTSGMPNLQHVVRTLRDYCNNDVETPIDQRCWPGEEDHKRKAHSDPATSSASTTKVGNSSPSSSPRGGVSSR